MNNIRISNVILVENNERAAALVEFSLVVVMFISLVLVFIDIARYYGTVSVLTAAAQRGASAAARIDNFDLDIANITADPGDVFYNRFRTARAAVAQLALRTPEESFLRPSSSSNPYAITLKQFSSFDSVGTKPSPIRVDNDIVIQRPGDSAQRSNSLWLHHPFRCSPAATGCINPRQDDESLEHLLERFPIQVSLEAQVPTFSPWLKALTARGEALVWRRNFVQSPFRRPSVSDAPLADDPSDDDGDPGDGGDSPPPVFCSVTEAICLAQGRTFWEDANGNCGCNSSDLGS